MLDRMAVLENVKRWAAEVGEIQLARLSTGDFGIRNKSNEYDLVTDVDQQSEQILIGHIRETYPGHSVLAEESGRSSREESEYLWIIDPLDGTVNYAHRFPLFSISIALQYQGDVILGVVYIPVLRELYHAVKGEGAFLNGNPIRVSQTAELKKAVLATGFPYDKAVDPDNNVNYFGQIVPQIGGIRRSGSAVFDLCMVAAGRLDGYWELKLNLWDMAAGSLIVKEAGGQIISLTGKKGISLIAANEVLGALILAELQRVNPGLSGNGSK